MRLFRLFTIYVLIGLFYKTAPAQNTSKSNGKLFIIGGGSRPSSMVDRIITESGIDNGGYGIILPMSSGMPPDSAVYYAKAQFLAKGFNNVYGLNFVKNEVLTKAKVDSIRNAKLVYIAGGDQNRFMDIVGGTEIERAIHQSFDSGHLIAGTSAGAAVMSKEMITGTELKHEDYASTFRNIQSDNIEIKTGLGMVNNVVIDQHFVKRSRYNRLLSAVIENPKITGIGIDESTAILIKGKNVEVVGDSQVIVFKNPKKSKNLHDDRLGAHGLKLDIYLPGETFKIKN